MTTNSSDAPLAVRRCAGGFIGNTGQPAATRYQSSPNNQPGNSHRRVRELFSLAKEACLA